MRTHHSFISAGTELQMLGMRKQGGSSRPPKRVQPGYSLAGEVMAPGAAVDHVQQGDWVACIGQGAFHASEVVVTKNLVARLPEGVSTRAGACAAMLCFAMEGVRKAGLTFGEHTLVVGAGSMGHFTSQFCLASGVRPFLTDLNASRLNRAVRGVRTFPGDGAGWATLREAVQPWGLEKVLVCMGGEADAVLARLYQVMSRSPDGLLQGRIVFSGGAVATIPFASPSGNLEFLSSAKAGPGYRDPRYEAGADYPQGYTNHD